MPLAAPTPAQPATKQSSVFRQNAPSGPSAPSGQRQSQESYDDPTRGPIPSYPAPSGPTPGNPFGPIATPLRPQPAPWSAAAPGQPALIPNGQQGPNYNGPRITSAEERYQQQMEAWLQAQLTLQGMGFDNAKRQIEWDQADAHMAYDLDMRGLNESYHFDRNRLGQEQFRNVDLQHWANEADLRTANRRFDTSTQVADARYANRTDELARALGIATDRHGVTVNDLNTQYGVTQDRIAADGRLLGAQLGYAGQERNLALEAAQLRHSAANRQATSEAIARGGGTSAGLGDTRDELARQLDLDFRSARLGYDRTATDIGRSREQLGFDDRLARNRLDTGTARANLDLRSARDASDIGNQRAFIDHSQAWRNADDTLYDAQNRHAVRRDYLNSLGRDYGLQAEEMDAALRLGAERLGLDYSSLIGRLADAWASQDDQKVAAEAALNQQVLLAAQ